MWNWPYWCTLALSTEGQELGRGVGAIEALGCLCGASSHALLLEWFFEGHREHEAARGFRLPSCFPKKIWCFFYDFLFALETSADTQMPGCSASRCLKAFCEVRRGELYIHSIGLPYDYHKHGFCNIYVESKHLGGNLPTPQTTLQLGQPVITPCENFSPARGFLSSPECLVCLLLSPTVHSVDTYRQITLLSTLSCEWHSSVTKKKKKGLVAKRSKSLVIKNNVISCVKVTKPCGLSPLVTCPVKWPWMIGTQRPWQVRLQFTSYSALLKEEGLQPWPSWGQWHSRCCSWLSTSSPQFK